VKWSYVLGEDLWHWQSLNPSGFGDTK